MSRILKTIYLGLFLMANSLLIRRVAYINDERSREEEQLGAIKWGEGFRIAGNDFGAGQCRIYSMKAVPYPRIGQPFYLPANKFIGRTNGSLEIWSWPYFQTDELDRRMLQEEIGGYNLRMTLLYRFYRKPCLQTTTNASIGLTPTFPHPAMNAKSK